MSFESSARFSKRSRISLISRSRYHFCEARRDVDDDDDDSSVIIGDEVLTSPLVDEETEVTVRGKTQWQVTALCRLK